MKKLPKKWSDYLNTQPETWMGLQLCDIEDKDGIHENVLVMCGQKVYGVLDESADRPAQHCDPVDVKSIISVEVKERPGLSLLVKQNENIR